MSDPVLDVAALRDLFELAEGDEAFVRELLSIYLEQSVKQLASIRAAHGSGNSAALARAAHSLLGASVNIGASAVAETCRAIERRALAGLPVPHTTVDEVAEALRLVRAVASARVGSAAVPAAAVERLARPRS